MSQQQKEELDANEPATPYKLEKARERGSIVRSADSVFGLVMLACVACVYGIGAKTVDNIALVVRRGLSLGSRDELTSASALSYIHTLALHAILAIAPAVFTIWTAAVVVAALQARGVFSSQPLTPDFSRLNPAMTLKRLFSMKSLYDLLRGVARIAAVSIAMVVWGHRHLDEIQRLATLGPRSMMTSVLQLLGSALLLLAAIVLVFALLEWQLNRWEYLRKMRMSRRELKDEHKEREGDPRIKRRLRELRLEWLKRAKQLAMVRGADVLLANPTHYAVALEYRDGEMPAPMITARGAGEMARRMREEAHRRGVPVVEHPPLTRALFSLNSSQLLVPEEHFEQVARVLRWVYAARGGPRKRAQVCK